jgi:hypothetical protein
MTTVEIILGVSLGLSCVASAIMAKTLKRHEKYFDGLQGALEIYAYKLYELDNRTTVKDRTNA